MGFSHSFFCPSVPAAGMLSPYVMVYSSLSSCPECQRGSSFPSEGAVFRSTLPKVLNSHIFPNFN